jgi:hypothetical protein
MRHVEGEAAEKAKKKPPPPTRTPTDANQERKGSHSRSAIPITPAGLPIPFEETILNVGKAKIRATDRH